MRQAELEQGAWPAARQCVFSVRIAAYSNTIRIRDLSARRAHNQWLSPVADLPLACKNETRRPMAEYNYTLLRPVVLLYCVQHTHSNVPRKLSSGAPGTDLWGNPCRCNVQST